MAILKDRNGNYATRFYFYGEGGKRIRIYKTLGGTAKEAKIKEAQLIARYKTGKPDPEKVFTVSQAIEAYLKLRGPSLAKSTLWIIEHSYKDRWLEGFGKDTDCISITKPQITEYLNKRATDLSKSTGKVLSKSSVFRELDLLRAVFSYCVENNYIKFSPFATFKMKRGKRVIRTTVLEADELKKLFTAFGNTKYQRQYHDLLKVLYLTASRVGEITSLNWSAVNFSRSEITIYMKKSKKAKTLPLSGELEGILKRLSLRATDRSGLIFKNRHGRKHSNDCVWKAFKNALLASGVNKPSASPHTLRHSFCSLMLDAGETLYQVSLAAGHANPAITAAVYGHSKTKALSGLMEKASTLQIEPTEQPAELATVPVRA